MAIVYYSAGSSVFFLALLLLLLGYGFWFWWIFLVFLPLSFAPMLWYRRRVVQAAAAEKETLVTNNELNEFLGQQLKL